MGNYNSKDEEIEEDIKVKRKAPDAISARVHRKGGRLEDLAQEGQVGVGNDGFFQDLIRPGLCKNASDRK